MVAPMNTGLNSCFSMCVCVSVEGYQEAGGRREREGDSTDTLTTLTDSPDPNPLPCLSAAANGEIEPLAASEATPSGPLPPTRVVCRENTPDFSLRPACVQANMQAPAGFASPDTEVTGPSGDVGLVTVREGLAARTAADVSSYQPARRFYGDGVLDADVRRAGWSYRATGAAL
jgi:hypothetical protein